MATVRLDLTKDNKKIIREEVFDAHKRFIDEEQRLMFELNRIRSMDQNIRELDARFEDALNDSVNRNMKLRRVEREVEAIEKSIRSHIGDDRVALIEAKAAFRDLEAIKNNLSHVLPKVRKFLPAIR